MNKEKLNEIMEILSEEIHDYLGSWAEGEEVLHIIERILREKMCFFFHIY